MSVDKVKDYFKKYNLDDRITEFTDSSETVALAAKVLGCKEQEIAKSLAFKVNDAPVIIVVAGDARIDNSKYKAEFKERAQMLKFEEVEVLTGHPVGGVCPFAVNADVSVYLDVTLKKLTKVFPAAGSKHNAISLTLAELEAHSHPLKWVDVCKDSVNTL